MQTVKEMRDRAERYRRHAVIIPDDKTRNALVRLAKELDEKADQIEAQMRLEDR